jgi:alkanesulfonate monooxygenase SsuD/methylene tetrahydromethanopterin reductase-like flavin-dependent oxidoreductase (luciferase family)
MSIYFGLGLLAGPPKGQINKWMDDLDASLPQLAGTFESLWMTDHFFWDDNPTYEAWTVMAYMVARWPQFKIGPMVLGQSYRNPALLAKMAATLQTLSGGRFIMGIGAGWKEDEYRAYDYPYPRPGIRIEQLEDTLEIFKRMWTEPGPVTYEGKHYKVVNAWCEPRPDPVPPIIVGGGGEKTMMLAARYADGWNLSDAPIERYSDRISVLKRHCKTIGRDFSSIELSWFGRLAVAKTEDEALALSNGRWNKTNAFVGTPQQAVDLMRPFVDAGVNYFMLEVLGLPDPTTIEMVLQDVLPRVRG